jgi:hypothetical protein
MTRARQVITQDGPRVRVKWESGRAVRGSRVAVLVRSDGGWIFDCEDSSNQDALWGVRSTQTEARAAATRALLGRW